MRIRHPLLDTRAKRAAFEEACFASRRLIRDRAKLYDRNQKPLAIPLTPAPDGGSIEWDWSEDEIVWSANLNFVDPDHRLPVTGTHPADGRSWQSKYIGVVREIWVRDVGWVDWDLCRVKIRNVGRRGDVFTIDASGKESEHLGDRRFVRTLSVRKNTPVWKAIRYIFRQRGETKFRLARSRRKLGRAKTFTRNARLGGGPWVGAQHLAKLLDDHQLFYGRDGVLTLRPLPNQPSWKLSQGAEAILLDFEQTSSDRDFPQIVILKGTKVWKEVIWDKTFLAQKAAVGDTNVVVDNKKHAVAGKQIRIGPPNRREKRDITSVASNTVHFTKRALSMAHPKGTPVWIRHRVEREKPAMGRAQLPPWHPNSAQSESGGDRPRVHFDELGDIRRKTDLDRKAQTLQNRARTGTELTRAFTSLWLPCDPMDLFTVGGQRIRAESGVISVSIDSPMVINHSTLQAPTKQTLRQAKRLWNKTHRGSR